MPLFAYDGRLKDGESVRGRVEAASDSAAATDLTASGVLPVRIQEVANESTRLEISWISRSEPKIKLADLAMFCRQMYTMTRSGVPIIRSLTGVGETSRNSALARVLKDLTSRLDAGHQLAAAMQSHPKVFSSLMVSLIHVGENTGRLEEAFMRLSQHLELEEETRRRIQSATRYPSVVLIVMIAAMVVLNIFVIPAFAQVFSGFGADLPLPTRMLIGCSNFFVNFWPHLLVTSVAVIYGARHYSETERGRLRWDRFKLSLPGVGSILERALLARFARTLSMTLASGVPITRGLNMTAEAVDNAYVTGRIGGMREVIERGEELTRAATQSGLFTPLVLQMLAIGEETGNVEELLCEVAEYYEREVDYDLKRIGDMIEPILIVGIGVMVLILALGIYLPMWDLAGAASPG